MKKILTYGLAIAIIIIFALSAMLRNERQDKERYKANQTSLLADIEFYKSESEKNVASVQKLTLTHEELKKNYTDAVRTADDLKIKIKRMQSISTTATETKVVVQTVVKDSIIYRDSVLDTITAFRWKDSWTNIEGRIKNDTVDLEVNSLDTLVQIVHKVPHKFWFIKWGCKAIRQEIVNKNPHTKITYTNYIELK